MTKGVEKVEQPHPIPVKSRTSHAMDRTLWGDVVEDAIEQPQIAIRTLGDLGRSWNSHSNTQKLCTFF